MSLELQLEKLNTNLEALIGVLAAGGAALPTAAAPAAGAAAAPAAARGPGRPKKAEAEAPAAAAGKDPFDDDAGTVSKGPVVTFDDVKAAFVALRDAATAGLGDEDKATEFTRDVMKPFGAQLSAIPTEKWVAAKAAAEKAVAEGKFKSKNDL